MITMKPLRIILASALLVAMAWAELKILPEGPLERTENTMLILTCMHSESSSPSDMSMKWHDKNGEVLTEQSGSKLVQTTATELSLIFTSLTLEDEGNYRCTAEVNGMEEEAAIEVNVKKEIKFLSPTVQAVINGTDARVWCRINQVIQNQTMKWYQRGPGGVFKSVANLDRNKFIPGYETKSGQEGSYLMIRSVTLQDSMNYTCSLEFRKEGTASNLNIKVIVAVPPKILPIYLDPTSPKEGDRLTMTCQADGVPPPTYMFYKGNKPLMETRSSDGKFVIESLKRTDEGTYTCSAMNDGGNQTENLFLDVKIPPMFEDTMSGSGTEDQLVEMLCTATGDPVPSLSWKRKDANVDYLSQSMSSSDIYVEPAGDTPIYDGPTTLYRRTLKLVFAKLKPEHAGEYVCNADNQYGVMNRTFKMDVLYKPNFNSQVTKLFYGWIGSNTNLTCIASSNPESYFTWQKNGQPLADGPDYTIVTLSSGLPNTAISYLKPKVTSLNVGAIFGEYICRANNRFGENEQTLIFQKAEAPGMVGLSLLSKATEIELQITAPITDGGQPVFKYMVTYGISDDRSDVPISRNFSRYPGQGSTNVTLTNLIPKTSYTVKIQAVNNVGLGAEKRITETTKDYSVPDQVKVISNREGENGNTFVLEWVEASNGGRPVSNYIVQYTEVIKVDTTGSDWKVVRESPEYKTTSVAASEGSKTTLKGLMRQTYYKAKISAVNSIGASEPTEFVFLTGLKVAPVGGTTCVQEASVGGMLLVVMVMAFSLPPLL